MHFTVGQKKRVTHIKKEKGSTLILLTTECKSDASQQTFSFHDEEDSGSSPQTSHCTQTTSHSNKIDRSKTNQVKMECEEKKIKVCGEILLSDNKLKIMKRSPSWQFKKGQMGLKKTNKKKEKLFVWNRALSLSLSPAPCRGRRETMVWCLVKDCGRKMDWYRWGSSSQQRKESDVGVFTCCSQSPAEVLADCILQGAPGSRSHRAAVGERGHWVPLSTSAGVCLQRRGNVSHSERAEIKPPGRRSSTPLNSTSKRSMQLNAVRDFFF